MLKANYHKHILKFNFPAGTSRGVLHEKVSWFIDLFNDSNPEIIGRGECSLIKGLSPDPETGYEEMLARICSEPERVLFSNEPELDHFPSIRFGLEMAWQDLKEGGKGVLFESDFTKGRAGIPINGLVWMGSRQNCLQQIKQLIDEGFTCIKMKIGSLDFDEEIDLLRAIRKEFHPDIIQLRVDANGAFLPDEALEKLKMLSEFHLHSIEQPIKPGNWQTMAALCEKTPLPIALDEELFAPGADNNKSGLLKTIKPQYLVLKPSMLGGFAKTQEWINEAESLNTGWWITSALESNTGLNALAQWTYTLSNPMHHGLGTGKLFLNNLPTRLYIENGYLHRVAMHGDSKISQFIESWKSGQQFFTLQTSGSTGKPKQIQASRQSMIHSAELTAEALGLRKDDTALMCMPVEFVAGKMMLVRAMVLGLNLVTVKPSLNPLIQVDDNMQIDFAAMTPMQVMESLKDKDSSAKLHRIKKLIIGGAPVSLQLEQELQQLPCEIYETYGMTETLTHVALRRINGKNRSEFFRGLQGIKIQTDERACLAIHAPHLDQPDVITNDLVEIINTNQFRWLGRADNVINSGGIKVFPEQVERKLQGMIAQRFIITGLPDKNFGEKVVLVIENPGPEGFETILELVAKKTERYEKPRDVFFLKKFPETSSGKIIRSEVQKLLRGKTMD